MNEDVKMSKLLLDTKLNDFALDVNVVLLWK